MSFIKKHFLAITAVMVFLIVSHYFHWDDRVVQLWKENQMSEEEIAQVSWFDDYYADIQHKAIDELLKAETSGLAWHPERNTLFTVTGKISKIAELSLEGDLLRSIDLINGGDTEAITITSDGRIAVIDERRCIIFLFELPEDNEIDVLDQSLVTHINVLELMPEINQPSNKGIEGMTWDELNSRFILAKERDPFGVYSLPYNLETGEIGELETVLINNAYVRDMSGLALDPRTQNLLVLSHESSLLKVLDDEGKTPNFMSFTHFTNGLNRGIKQAEGVAIDGKGTLYVVSEPNLFYRFNKRK